MPAQQILLGRGTTIPATINGSGKFDGSSYLEFPASSDWNFFTNAFTIECYVYAKSTSITGWFKRIWSFSSNPSSGNPSDGMTLEMDTSNQFRLRFDNSVVLTSPSLSTYKWYHVAVTKDGGDVQLHVNGVKASSSPIYYGNNLLYGSHTFRVGAHHGMNNSQWDGYISNLHVCKQQLYSAYSDFTPPTNGMVTNANTKLLCLNDFNDVTKEFTGRTMTITGSVTAAQIDPIDHGGIDLNGNGYIESPDSADWDFDNDPFTVECWYFPRSHSSYEGLVAQWPNGNYNTTNGWTLEPVGGVLDFYYCIQGTTNFANCPGPNTQIPLGSWNHCAVVRSADRSTMRTFLNGVAGNDHNCTGVSLQDGTGSLRIAGGVAGGGNIDGMISNVRITKGQAVYWNNFTPPSEPVTEKSQGAIAANVKLLTCSSAISSTASRKTPSNFWTTGSVGETSNDPFSPYSSVYYDANEYLEVAQNQSAFNIATNESFTIEAFINMDSMSRYNYICLRWASSSSPGGGNYLWRFGVDNSNRLFFAGNISVQGGSSLTNGVWYHVAVVRSGNSNLKLYINGTEDGSSTGQGSSLEGANEPLAIGANREATTYSMRGYMTNLRYTVGQALYTSNFTTPTDNLTLTSQGANESNVVFLGLRGGNSVVANVKSPGALTIGTWNTNNNKPTYNTTTPF